MRPLRILDLFSGIGAFSLGLERAGMQTVRFCEINPFGRAVLAKHWPDVPCHDDVTTMQFQEGEADVICGGFPCQDVSLAGRRAGLAGARSGLYRQLVRAFRVVRPRVAIVENVSALLSDGMGTVLGDLAEGGNCVEWDCVPASAIGAPHQRDRVWIVAHTNGIDGRRGAGGKNGAEASNCFEERPCAGNAADATSARSFSSSFAGIHCSEESAGSQHVEPERHAAPFANTESVGWRQGRSWRPPDSFARIRDEACRNAAYPLLARLAFHDLGSGGYTLRNNRYGGKGNAEGNTGAIWPDEPALSGVDDGDAHWMDRIAATGNQVVPQIPELIGLAILDGLTVDA